ncbi:hypothetical protein BG015_008431 [Linnemannia schmuckeri]|uniref:Cas12f1-like TNB domain-containing protein n=1 Tax=Linnemannia schmuckeri TaxID=64567 RepID=A0A9P5RZH9_9FUNG|nr:hypothetical protein BG015_008431 [Linnemannia schmuckeri]
MDDVVTTLGLASRNHLVVLCIVSHNDCNRNIYGLGCATNFKIIQDMPLVRMDVPTMVAAYLSDKRVHKSKKSVFRCIHQGLCAQRTIADSLPTDFGTEGSVTITLARNLDSPLSDLSFTLTLEDVKSRFEDAKKQHTERKKNEAERFVTFSERELLVFFYDQSFLANKIRNLAKDEFPNGVAVTYLENLVGSKARYRGTIKSWSLDRIKDHLRGLAQGAIKPKDYTTKGYLLQGSIRFDGLEIQLVAFKMELQSARFKRSQDAYDPKKIKVLRIDLGQACVVGASGLLPDALDFDKKGKMKHSDQNTKGKMKVISTSTAPSFSASTSTPAQPKPILFNLTMKQKARIKRRNCLLLGKDASVVKYFEELERVQDRLGDFYNGGHMRFKRHGWNVSRAREEEFKAIANRLLGLAGGSIGEKRGPKNLVVIGIGLGQFSCKIGLTSLHGTFISFFVQLARSLGYIVVGINEFYTSKKCPIRFEFVCQVNIRRLYCPNCEQFFPHNIMAAHNMCNIVKSHLLHQRRPKYLQPIDEDGKYPWMEDDGSNSSPESLAKDSKSSAGSTLVPGSKRRKLIDDDEHSLTPVRGAKRRQLEEDVKPSIQTSEVPGSEDPTL